MRSLPIALAGIVSLVAVAPSAPADRTDADEPEAAILTEAGVAADGASLLKFLRRHTGKDADLQALARLLEQLGSSTFAEREEASRKLVRLGLAGVPGLRKAQYSPDKEVSRRARDCLRRIAADTPHPWLLANAARLLGKRGPEGAEGVLLAYLPYVGDELIETEVWWALDRLARKGEPLDPTFAAALRHPLPARRAAAAYVLGRRGDKGQRASAAKMLADPDPDVRLRAAQGLLGAGDGAGIPTLIALLEEAPLTLGWQAEEMLRWAAGEGAPAAVLGAGEVRDRRRCRRDWQAWWEKHRATVDVGKAVRGSRRPGLVFVSSYKLSSEDEEARLGLYGCDEVVRWQVESDSLHWQVRLLPEPELLVVEGLGVHRKRDESVKSLQSGGSISRWDLHGKVLWRCDTVESATACAFLPDGNLLVTGSDNVYEMNPEGQEVSVLHVGIRGDISIGATRPEPLPNGKLLAQNFPRPGRLLLLEIDRHSGKALRHVVVQDKLTFSGYYARVEAQRQGTYLLGNSRDGRVFEIDRGGKTIWRSPSLKAVMDATRLPNGNTLVATIQRIAELDPAGKTVHNIPLPHQWTPRRIWPCLGLLRLGFD